MGKSKFQVKRDLHIVMQNSEIVRRSLTIIVNTYLKYPSSCLVDFAGELLKLRADVDGYCEEIYEEIGGQNGIDIQ